MKKIILFFMLLVLPSLSFAGTCTIITHRKACPGKELETFKPYDGKNPTEDSKSLPNIEACLKFAEKSSKIIRRGTLHEKNVRAYYNDQDLEKTFTDNAECH